MVITDTHIKDLKKKLEEKKQQKIKSKEYQKLKFEYNHPILFKLKNLFDKGYDKLQGVFKIAKKDEEIKTVEKVHVSIYADEFETVKDELEITEITSRNIREALGLPQTHSKTGVTTKLIAKIRNMTKEDKEKMYKGLPDKEEE